jgi:hypothetical protein
MLCSFSQHFSLLVYHFSLKKGPLSINDFFDSKSSKKPFYTEGSSFFVIQLENYLIKLPLKRNRSISAIFASNLAEMERKMAFS